MKAIYVVLFILIACSAFAQDSVQITNGVEDSTAVVHGYSSSGGVDVWTWIDRVIAIFTALGVVGGTIVAMYGISSWRKQRRGEDAYRLARKLRKELLYLRSEFYECRKYPAPIVRAREEIESKFLEKKHVAKWSFYRDRGEKIAARTETIRSVYYELEPLGCGLDNVMMSSILWYMRQYIDQAGSMDQLKYDIDLGLRSSEDLQPADVSLLNVYHSNFKPAHGSDFTQLSDSAFQRIFPNLQEIIDGTLVSVTEN